MTEILIPNPRNTSVYAEGRAVTGLVAIELEHSREGYRARELLAGTIGTRGVIREGHIIRLKAKLPSGVLDSIGESFSLTLKMGNCLVIYPLCLLKGKREVIGEAGAYVKEYTLEADSVQRVNLGGNAYE